MPLKEMRILWFFVLSIVIFALVYMNGNGGFTVNGERRGSLSASEAFYMSANTQTLLGNSAIEPTTTQMRAAVAVQASITLGSLLGVLNRFV